MNRIALVVTASEDTVADNHGWAFRHSDTVGSRSWCRSRVSEVGGQTCRKSRCRKSRLEFRHHVFFFLNEEDILRLKWKCHLHLTVCFIFFRESRRHLELFSGIAHELIAFSRAKFSRVKKHWNKRQYFNWCCRVNICFSGGCSIRQLSLCQLWQCVSLRSSTPISVKCEVIGQEAEIRSSLGEILENPVEEEAV